MSQNIGPYSMSVPQYSLCYLNFFFSTDIERQEEIWGLFLCWLNTLVYLYYKLDMQFDTGHFVYTKKSYCKFFKWHSIFFFFCYALWKNNEKKKKVNILMNPFFKLYQYMTRGALKYLIWYLNFIVARGCSRTHQPGPLTEPVGGEPGFINQKEVLISSRYWKVCPR